MGVKLYEKILALCSLNILLNSWETFRMSLTNVSPNVTSSVFRVLKIRNDGCNSKVEGTIIVCLEVDMGTKFSLKKIFGTCLISLTKLTNVSLVGKNSRSLYLLQASISTNIVNEV